jgi:hypothetical protein
LLLSAFSPAATTRKWYVFHSFLTLHPADSSFQGSAVAFERVFSGCRNTIRRHNQASSRELEGGDYAKLVVCQISVTCGAGGT